MILDYDHNYLHMSHSGLKTYGIQTDTTTIWITNNRIQKIKLYRVNRDTDCYYKLESHPKAMKEHSTNELL